MDPVRRPAPFVLVSTGHGSLIVARNDYRMVDSVNGFGVGFQLFNNSLFDPDEVGLVLQMLNLRRTHFGDGVQALDCGANIGVHTVEWARQMSGWGTVVGIEAQERIFYALAGNVALNNCLNARVLHAAVGGEVGVIEIPNLDYSVASSFGSFEIKKRTAGSEFIGQDVDYEAGPKTPVNLVTIDSLEFERLDFIKLDVEGMEIEALQGAMQAIKTFKPQMLVEIIKAEAGSVDAFLTDLGYRLFPVGINILAIHQDDPSLSNISVTP
jgi:FkbM family methyltransferase